MKSLTTLSTEMGEKWIFILGEPCLEVFVENPLTLVEKNMHRKCNKELNKCEKESRKILETVTLRNSPSMQDPGCPYMLKFYHQKATFIKTSASLPVCCRRVHK